MDHYAADVSAVVEHLDPAQCGPRRGTPPAAARSPATSPATVSPQGRVAKAVLISAVPPLMGENRAESGRDADRGV